MVSSNEFTFEHGEEDSKCSFHKSHVGANVYANQFGLIILQHAPISKYVTHRKHILFNFLKHFPFGGLE